MASAIKSDAVSNDARSNYVRKNECLKMIKVLNHNFKNLEKEQKSHIMNRKNEKDYAPVYEMYITSDMNLKNEKYKLAQRLDSTANMIGRFRLESQIVKPSQHVLDTLRSLMEQIDGSITDCKESFMLALNELDDEERTLAKEVDVYEKKIAAWSASDHQSAGHLGLARPASSVSDKLTDSNLLKEVIDFDKFLIQNGNHTGGWEEIDHSLFLKTRNKHRGNLAYIDELVETIATKTREQIEQHEDWYVKYLVLNEAKKKAIQQWKEAKKSSVNEVVSQVDAELKLNQEIEKELKSRFERQRELEKQERNKKLNEWKLERGIERAREQERKRIEEEKRREKEERERLHKEELRRKVEDYKRHKDELNEYIEMEQILLREAEREARTKQASVEINYFKSRDMERERQKKLKQQREQELLEEKQKRLESAKLKVEVDRDPTRLYKMTSTWKNRVNTLRSESCGPVITYQIPRLATPTWRQNI